MTFVATLPPPPGRAELGDHLAATRIAGIVATPRGTNLGAIRGLAQRQRRLLFGLTLAGEWTEADVLALMAERVGVNPDETYRTVQALVERRREAI